MGRKVFKLHCMVPLEKFIKSVNLSTLPLRKISSPTLLQGQNVNVRGPHVTQNHPAALDRKTDMEKLYWSGAGPTQVEETLTVETIGAGAEHQASKRPGVNGFNHSANAALPKQSSVTNE